MEEECSVCLSPLDGTITTVGCCSKQFHTRCLIKCTDIKNECPLCRAKNCIPDEETILLIHMEDPHEVIQNRARLNFCYSLLAFSILTIIYIKVNHLI